jgi:ubiquinone biosynthesis monooxygenase Coq7
MNHNHFTSIDRLIINFDNALKTLAAGSDLTSERPSPALKAPQASLTEEERRHAAGLMRVNHTGEVCAQALYQGQALTAKLPHVRQEMEHAAEEEIDHLVWCQKRLDDLGSKASITNPLFYGMSFAIGAGAGLISDKMSLGFVAATEDQVCKHLEKHLQELPEQDLKSRAVVRQMLVDEALHADMALDAGGYRFPTPVKHMMSFLSKVMTKTVYRI